MNWSSDIQLILHSSLACGERSQPAIKAAVTHIPIEQPPLSETQLRAKEEESGLRAQNGHHQDLHIKPWMSEDAETLPQHSSSWHSHHTSKWLFFNLMCGFNPHKSKDFLFPSLFSGRGSEQQRISWFILKYRLFMFSWQL